METLGKKSPERWNNARGGVWRRAILGPIWLQVTEIQLKKTEVKRYTFSHETNQTRVYWLQAWPRTPSGALRTRSLSSAAFFTLASFSGSCPSWNGQVAISNSILIFCQLSNPSGEKRDSHPQQFHQKSQVSVSVVHLWPYAHP